jgi:hypothetical protein
MASFQISITPSRRVAARFVTEVRRQLQKALVDEGLKTGITQSEIARTIGVHRSVVNRELRGYKDITLGRLAELAFAMGLTPKFELVDDIEEFGVNTPPPVVIAPSSTVAIKPPTRRESGVVIGSSSHTMDLQKRFNLEAA